MSDRRYRDEKWLREQYVEKGRTTYDIAEVCGCGATTVCEWLKRHGIERKTTPDERLEDGEWVREQYVEYQQSLSDIANECDCSSRCVAKWLKRHGIETRSTKNLDRTGPNNPNWNGGRLPYGPGWNKSKRRSVRERDGHRCQGCGITQTGHQTEYDEKLHVHHLIKARDIDDPEERNAVENLITLCRDCHREWERLSEAGIRPQIAHVATD